ncbi:MAG: LPS-assembly protein LptD [Alphaproteobacteria bacterium]|jgi:LPS-assembly protein|nr:LPS-assembly protein LptD [Alphaproteobacteria bacterium]
MKVAYRLITVLLASCSTVSLAAAAGHAPILIPLASRAAADDPSETAGSGGSKEVAKPTEVLIRADKMIYDANTSVVTAEGNVEVIYGPRTLSAEKLTYDQKTRVVIAEGNATIREANGTSLSGSRIEVTDDMRDGVIESLNVMIAGRGHLAAARATRSDGSVLTLEKAAYTTCKPCKEEPTKAPTWQIKAFKVIYNQEKARVEYEDAFFEVFGVPVAYLPYFSHSDPQAPRQSGFLVPGIGHSTDLGYFAEVPYYFALDPSYDLLLSPMYTENDGPLLKGEWRQRTETGAYNIQASGRYGEARDRFGNEQGDETLQGHIFGRGRFQIDEIWRWGYDAQLTSNDTYLKRYDISSLDRLENNLFVEGIDGRSYAAINSWYFQGLRETDDPGLTPLVLPLIELEYVPDETVFGGRFSLLGNALYLHRGEGQDTARVSSTASWKLPLTTPGGHMLTFFANLRADAYQVTDTGVSGTDDETVARVLPWAGAEWRYPLVRTDWGWKQIIEPIVQFIAAPYGGNPDEIPNEDSAAFEFDETNLFSFNKFPGLDRWETGPRVNAGVRAAAYFDEGFVEAILGQSYRFHEDNAFTEESGLRNQQSDYVGRLTIQPDGNIRLVHRFRIDQSAARFERNELYAEAFDPDWYSFKAGYVLLEPDPLLPDQREEVNVAGSIQALDNIWLRGSGRRDLAGDEMIESKFGISYEDDCAEFGIDFRRRFTRDRDIEPSSSFLFTFRLKGVN